MAKFWLEGNVLKSDESLNKFNKDQKYEIQIGLKDGLTNEQVAIYAKPEFDYIQMDAIKLGIEAGLTSEQISLYSTPEFNGNQMYQIYYALKKGIDVAYFLNPELCAKEMESIRLSLEEIDEAAFYLLQGGIDNAEEFEDMDQLEQIRLGLANGLTPKQIAIYAKPELDYGSMCAIREDIISKIKDTIVLDLKESGIDTADIRNIELKENGIYFCDEKLTTMEEFLETHPELQPEPQELEQEDIDFEK